MCSEKSPEAVSAARRRFLKALAWLSPGLLLASPAMVRARKPEFRSLLRGLEAELLLRSTPRKKPSITCSHQGEGKFVLSRQGRSAPLLACNRTGQTVWEAIDGKKTYREISGLLQERFRVVARKADVDCLLFLAELRSRGAIDF